MCESSYERGVSLLAMRSNEAGVFVLRVLGVTDFVRTRDGDTDVHKRERERELLDIR